MRSSTLAVCLLLTFAASLLAADPRQSPVRPPEPPETRSFARGIAVIDMARVFQEHHAFQLGLIELKNEAAVFDRVMQLSRRELIELNQEAQQAPEGGKKRTELQSELLRRKADLEANVHATRQDLMQREAELYSTTYREVQHAVARFATQHGIEVVLRHAEPKLDPNDRKALLNSVNRNIVFHNRVDITDRIIHVVNSRDLAAAEKATERK